MGEPLPQDVKAAVDAMFRIRAVESPADANGLRTIWHRGMRGAELVTEIDAAGKVKSQQLTLLDEQVRWDRGPGFSLGAPRPLLERVSRAVGSYSGHDRFLVHLRDHLSAELKGEALPEASPLPEPPPASSSGVPWAVLIGVGLVLAALGLAALLYS
jgi:hypothetical protein